MLFWTNTELKYYAKYVKLTNYKFFDYYQTLSDEEEEMISILLKLLVFNMYYLRAQMSTFVNKGLFFYLYKSTISM